MKSLRYALVSATLLAAASASAQESPSWIEYVRGPNISFSEATWELFATVADNKYEDSSYIEGLPVRLNLDMKRNRALVDHMKAAVGESRTYSTSLRKDMCKKRATLTTIESVATELERIDFEVLNHRDMLMAKAGPILDLDGTARLEAVVMELRDRMTLPRINYVQAMRDRKEDAPAVMTRLCKEFAGTP